MRKVMPTVRSDLTDKVILITGASRGIGRSVALNCAQAGAEVIITGRTMGALEELDECLLMLSGDRSKYLTGAVIPIDGGHALGIRD